MLDACVLAGLFKRNLLLSCAEAGLFQPAWSAIILAETQYATRRIHAAGNHGFPWDDIDSQLNAMQSEFPDALMRAIADEPNLALPDANDRHVVGTALAAHASMIVTDNLSDFPRKTMKEFSLEILSADAFLARILLGEAEDARAVVQALRRRLGNMPILTSGDDVTSDVIVNMKRAGLKKTATVLNKHAHAL